MPFGAAVLLGILSVVCFLQAVGRKETTEAQPLFRGMLWPRVILVFIALFAYAQLIPFGGFTCDHLFAYGLSFLDRRTKENLEGGALFLHNYGPQLLCFFQVVESPISCRPSGLLRY